MGQMNAAEREVSLIHLKSIAKVQGFPGYDVTILAQTQPPLQERVGQLLPDPVERPTLVPCEIRMTRHSLKRHFQLLGIVRVQGGFDEADEILVAGWFIQRSSLQRQAGYVGTGVYPTRFSHL